MDHILVVVLNVVVTSIFEMVGIGKDVECMVFCMSNVVCQACTASGQQSTSHVGRQPQKDAIGSISLLVLAYLGIFLIVLCLSWGQDSQLAILQRRYIKYAIVLNSLVFIHSDRVHSVSAALLGPL
jgi:hypothetical protein